MSVTHTHTHSLSLTHTHTQISFFIHLAQLDYVDLHVSHLWPALISVCVCVSHGRGGQTLGRQIEGGFVAWAYVSNGV